MTLQPAQGGQRFAPGRATTPNDSTLSIVLPSRITRITKNFSLWVHTQVARHTSKFKYSAAWLALFAAYLALAIVATYPLTFQATNHVFGLGTPPLNIWALSWVNRQLVQDPLSLFDGGVT